MKIKKKYSLLGDQHHFQTHQVKVGNGKKVTGELKDLRAVQPLIDISKPTNRKRIMLTKLYL